MGIEASVREKAAFDIVVGIQAQSPVSPMDKLIYPIETDAVVFTLATLRFLPEVLYQKVARDDDTNHGHQQLR